jgi:hypothetical protein
MKLIITVTTKKADGPMPNFEALKQALEEELPGYTFDAQNENSDLVSVVELDDVTVERA